MIIIHHYDKFLIAVNTSRVLLATSGCGFQAQALDPAWGWLGEPSILECLCDFGWFFLGCWRCFDWCFSMVDLSLVVSTILFGVEMTIQYINNIDLYIYIYLCINLYYEDVGLNDDLTLWYTSVVTPITRSLGHLSLVIEVIDAICNK